MSSARFTSSSVTGLFPSSADAELERLAWESGIEVLSVEEIDEMDSGARVDYLQALHSWQVERGITDGPYQRYREWQKLCKQVTDEITGERCLRPNWAHAKHCLTHASIDEIDPKGAERRRKAAARARLAEMTESALTYWEDVMADVNHERYPPSVRMKIAEQIMDRNGITPKLSESHSEVSGHIEVEHTSMDVIQARLDRLAAANQEIPEIEAEVVEEQRDVA